MMNKALETTHLRNLFFYRNALSDLHISKNFRRTSKIRGCITYKFKIDTILTPKNQYFLVVFYAILTLKKGSTPI